METKTKTTKEVILEQLLENTGRELGDSGDHYGRSWQRNQGKTWEDFTRNPVITEARVYKHGPNPVLEITGTVSLAAWLDANLDYDSEMQASYEMYVETEGDPDDYDLVNMEAFAESINDGDHWCGSKYPATINSYNDECDLSQTIQFVEFAYGGDTYVLLQVHGGCDVRGGYTSPKAYKVCVDYFGNWRIDGYGCTSHQWDESMSDCNDSKVPTLTDYPVHDLVWVPTLEHDLQCLKQTNMDTEEVRETMRRNAEELKQEYFREFCDALTEHSVVVWERKAYFVGDDGPEEIYADCYGLYQ